METQKIKGLIFSIEEFAVYDGPGIRCSVFFKGCPLRCNWCHNPEGLEKTRQLVKNPNKCISCGKCDNYNLPLERIISVCSQRALRISGKYYDSDELVDLLMKNKDIFDRTGGGVTFSGGEPLMQADFLDIVLKKLNGQIHTAIETSGYASTKQFIKIANSIDLFIMDLKIINPELCKKYTKKSNSIILRNFDWLKNNFYKDIIIRVPLIPSITDTDMNLESIACLCQGYKNLTVELLSYNKFAGSKYAMMGKKYMPNFDENAIINSNLELFYKKNIKAILLK